MAKPEKMSTLTKTLWVGLPLAIAFIGIRYEDQQLAGRDATPQEQAQLNNILRPAAVRAAAVAISMYREHPEQGFVDKPPASLPHPKNAAELFVTTQHPSKGYTIEVDMQRVKGQLDPKTVYDVAIYKGKSRSAIDITKEDVVNDYLGPDFSFAMTPDQETVVNFQINVTGAGVKHSLNDAKTISQLVTQELSEFDKNS